MPGRWSMCGKVCRRMMYIICVLQEKNYKYTVGLFRKGSELAYTAIQKWHAQDPGLHAQTVHLQKALNVVVRAHSRVMQVKPVSRNGCKVRAKVLR